MASKPKPKKHIKVAHYFFALALIAGCVAFPLPIKASGARHEAANRYADRATTLFIIFVLIGFMSLNAHMNPPRP